GPRCADEECAVDIELLQRVSSTAWQVAPTGGMRVPALIFATADLIRGMDDKVFQQITNVAALPGIVRAAYAMPDAHWGYGFRIGGVAAFDADAGGVISAGGVGFDISCGVRTHLTGLPRRFIEARQSDLADALYKQVPVGVGAEGKISLDDQDT